MFPMTLSHENKNFIPLIPMHFVPPMPVPLAAVLPPHEPMVQVVPCGTNIQMYDVNNGVVDCPKEMLVTNQFGQIMPPLGYTFVKLLPESSLHSASTDSGLGQITSAEEFKHDIHTLDVDTIVDRSRSSSVVSNKPEPVKKSKKFRHRSKQERILEVHAELKEKYTKLGLYASDDEVLRGYDTVRVHVKTYHALNQVKCPLEELENDRSIKILKIATPFSMKNRFQKKGFILYLKLASPDMVPSVQNIFAKYKEHFAKCDVALSKQQSSTVEPVILEPLKVERSFEGKDFSDWSAFEPPVMKKMNSLGA